MYKLFYVLAHYECFLGALTAVNDGRSAMTAPVAVGNSSGLCVYGCVISAALRGLTVCPGNHRQARDILDNGRLAGLNLMGKRERERERGKEKERRRRRRRRGEEHIKQKRKIREKR